MYNTDVEISLGILQIWFRMKSNIEAMAEQKGLTPPQVFVLHNLYNNDSIIMGSLAKRLHCDASNITNLVDKLESQQLIERRDVTGDRRAKQLTITNKGKLLMRELFLGLPENIGLARLNTTELNNLNETIKKINTEV